MFVPSRNQPNSSSLRPEFNQLYFVMPAALRDLLRFEYSIVVDRRGRLQGKNQMLAARVNPSEG